MTDPRTLAVCDPGKNLAGLAWFEDGILADCTLIRAPNPFTTALKAAEWFASKGYANNLVCENQQVYAGPRKNNPNDLIPLAQCVGGVVVLVNAGEYEVVLPRIWTKGVRKELRLSRAYTALESSEQILVDKIKPASLKHNVLDAVALGKWFLKSKGFL